MERKVKMHTTGESFGRESTHPLEAVIKLEIPRNLGKAMDPHGTTAPPPHSTDPSSERDERRRLFEQLRREGRGWGQAPFGFRWVGRSGSRRLAPDPAQRELMALVVSLRDGEGLSWGKISDRIEEHLAEQEGRRPRSRGWRSGWTEKTCWRAYHAAKQIEAEGEPQVTHRRCSDCGHSLPIESFRGEQTTCQDCLLTAGFRRRDEQRQAIVVSGILAAARAVEAGKPSENLRLIFQTIIDQAGGMELFGIDVEQTLVRLVRDHPGSKRVLDALSSLLRLLAESGHFAASEEGVQNLSAQELDDEIRKELQPFIDHFRGDIRKIADLLHQLMEDEE